MTFLISRSPAAKPSNSYLAAAVCRLFVCLLFQLHRGWCVCVYIRQRNRNRISASPTSAGEQVHLTHNAEPTGPNQLLQFA